MKVVDGMDAHQVQLGLVLSYLCLV